MGELRTDDCNYGQGYWDTLDGGRGYQDSLLWSDIAFILHELFGVEKERDIAMEVGVIDVGCAYGYLLRHLRKRGFDCRGIDFSRYALDNAPDDVKTYLSWFDLTSAATWCDKFGRRSQFELVTCFETLEHIPEQSVQQALWNLKKLMARGGTLVSTICTDLQPDWDTDPTHVTIKPREWWVEQLAQAGFMIIPDAVEELRRFHLFRHHDGVFVCLQG